MGYPSCGKAAVWNGSVTVHDFRWNETAGLAGSAFTLSQSALEVQKETSHEEE
jgi:uncharacterized protein YbbK (DUF523 family)